MKQPEPAQRAGAVSAAGGAAPRRESGRPDPDATERTADGGSAGATDGGFYLYGVVRVGSRRARRLGGAGPELVRIRYRDIEALVRPAPFGMPPLEESDLLAHQRAVEQVMRRGTILPAPPGIVFSGRRAVIRFLQDQYLVLEEGLTLLADHWEFRMHLVPTAPGEPDAAVRDLAMHIYADLRRFARAAIPFPQEGRRLLSAAFLVERGAWVAFVERADDLGTANPALTVDITGPWPPYDFVKMTG